ncbi:MAG: biopolymer transporter ExbB [Alphaproteobacteria bacterium]|nr:biopolymer transporter ExbB [Alphaproteobacteria bacterium]
MTDAATNMADAGQEGQEKVAISILPPKKRIDLATVLGLVFAIGLIAVAIYIGHSKANFFNVPSLMIVVFGTMAVTSVSYSGDDLRRLGAIFANTLSRRTRKPSAMAVQLMNLAVIARKRGLLALAGADKELRNDPFLHRAVTLVTDGYSGDDIDRLLGQEVDSLIDRHRRSANIIRRASEVAPAMGLIGTLVGLVQMLAELDNPENIGPAMAVALLTTFYGAILGTVVLAPLAVKLEKNSNEEAMIKNIILTAMGSIARQENPRRLEMLLNSELPPGERIKYFD